ncbi:type VII secretion protein EccB [Goodfellowiella coeruleoviolacea]|uniref:Type VII secretion protein EccB n=1 Tax=Goodfellowiella coeruleoviolacea TaxID=334858 RepID=A0AAE3KEY9_9PSEU|nr:type VII secretion protein EccB [Goodfellowiella coeruleoviolacea]MCP2165816.1 type VII secretion protein EccB [Goodfellowiella coeruleoviolacea]
MASTPTTKSQVQAYRFVLRRMQSALVRRDAVMLHDPMRTHSRATGVGVILACLGLLGFVVWGLFSPAPKLPDSGIVISKQTGAVYVMRQDPKRLIPMTNLASARLYLLAQQNPDRGAAQGAAGSEAAAGAPVSDQAAQATVVDEAALGTVSKDRLTGIIDAPQSLPEKPEQRIGSDWMVCDNVTLDRDRRDPTSVGGVTTTVLAGLAGGTAGQELADNTALLVKAPTNKTYLVYKRPKNANQTNASALRAEIDLTDAGVAAAFKLSGKTPRAVTAGLLSAIPEGKKISAPDVAGKGSAASYLSGSGIKVGDVVEVSRAGTASYHLVLKDGLQEVTRAVADLIKFSNDENDFKKVNVEEFNQAPTAPSDKQVDVRDFPDMVPEILEAAQHPVTCLSWTASDESTEKTSVTYGSRVPVPTGQTTVKLNQTGATGEVVDEFYMPPGKSGVVRSAASPEDFKTGPIQLISERGVKYGVPDPTTATALGLGKDYVPAPESIVRLLPSGAQLNRNDAQMSYDGVSSADLNGTYPSVQPGGQGN